MRSFSNALLVVWALVTGLASILGFALAWFMTPPESQQGFIAWLSSPVSWLFSLPLWVLVVGIACLVGLIVVFPWANRRAPTLEIGPPTPASTTSEYVAVHGSGASPGSRVLVVNALIGSKCWLQPREATPDSNGDWVHPGTQLNSFAPRYVYALAVRQQDVTRVRALFESDIMTAAELARLLRRNRVKHQLSRRWSLVRVAA